MSRVEEQPMTTDCCGWIWAKIAAGRKETGCLEQLAGFPVVVGESGE